LFQRCITVNVLYIAPMERKHACICHPSIISQIFIARNPSKLIISSIPLAMHGISFLQLEVATPLSLHATIPDVLMRY